MKGLNLKRLSTLSRAKSFFQLPLNEVANTSLLWSDNSKSELLTKWLFYNDKANGGKSNCESQIITENSQSFMRLQGELLSLVPDLIDPTTATRSGFCAAHASFSEPFDMMEFQGIELVMRSSQKLSFIVNMKADSFLSDEVYQIGISISPSTHWKTVHLPLNSFHLTKFGKSMHHQRVNDGMKTREIGFLFQLRLFPEINKYPSLYATSAESTEHLEMGETQSENPPRHPSEPVRVSESFSLDVLDVRAMVALSPQYTFSPSYSRVSDLGMQQNPSQGWFSNLLNKFSK